MRLIDGLTYTEDDQKVFFPDPVDRNFYAVRAPDNYKTLAAAGEMMLQALGIDHLHVAVVAYGNYNPVHRNLCPQAFLDEFRGYRQLKHVRFDPLSKIFVHYMQYRIYKDDITKINADVVGMAKDILIADGQGLGLVVLSSFAVPQRDILYDDHEAMARVVVGDLKPVFRGSGESDLQNAAALAEFV